MRKVLILSVALCLLLLAALTVTVAARRQEPVTPLLAMLRLTDCEPPCWIGIVPGQTRIEAARERINALFGQSSLIQTQVRTSTSPVNIPMWRVAVSSSPILVGLGARDGITVDSINFSFYDAQITVADLVRAFGSPSRMARWHQNFPYFVMAYGTDERGMMAFNDLADSFQWTQPVKAIVLYAKGQLPTPPDDLFPWYGFHTLRGYFQRMP